MSISAKPLISIIVAIYNVEKFLPECLDSIVKQTYNKLEIILVDDGALDGSGKIVDKYASQDKRVKALHKENGGQSSARNLGLDNATGDYIIFVDGDDYLAPDFVEYMLKLANHTKADIVMSKNCFTTSDRTQVSNDTITTITPEEFILSYLYPRVRIGVWNKMYKRDFIEQNKLRFRLRSKTGEGMTFITFAAQYVKSIGVGTKKAYHYRTDNTGSATTKPNVKTQGMGSLENLNYIIDNIELKTPRIKKALQWHMWACYRYILLNIIGAKEENEYHKLYKESIRQIQKLAPKALTSEAPALHKLRAVLTAISPVCVLNIEIARRNYRLAKGKGK